MPNENVTIGKAVPLPYIINPPEQPKNTFLIGECLNRIATALESIAESLKPILITIGVDHD